MTKSTPSTSTTVNQSPIATAQQPFMTGLWTEGNAMAGSGNPQNAYGWPALQGIQDYAQNNYQNTAGAGLQAVPGGLDFVNAALRGNAGGLLPGASQVGSLSGLGTNASNTGQYFANLMGGAASNYLSAAAPYQSGLTGLAGQYGGLTGAGYGSYGALNNLGGAAAQGGQQTAQSLYGLAPQGMAAGWPSEQQLMANSGMAISGNPAFSSGLTGLASGQYINPATNPALGGTIQSALQPLAQQFMTATAPLTASNFEGGGRYGSGAYTNAQGQNQYALGQAMQGAVSNIVNNAYNTGLSTTLGAGSALGGIYNQGVANSSSAAQAAGQLGQSGVNLTGNLIQGGGSALQSGYGTGGNLYGAGAGALNSLGGTGLGGASSNYGTAGTMGLNALNSMISGYGSAGQTANQGYGTAANAFGQGGQLANAGTLNLGGLAQMTPDLANYPMSQLSTAFNAPWAPIQNYAGLLGQPLQGNSTQTSTQPYYQNTASNAISGALGIAQLASLI
jgi:hypothetical protein